MPVFDPPWETADAADVAALRAQLPSVSERIYLNTGTAGPMPRAAAAAIVRETERELAEGRAELPGFERAFATMAALRERFARIVGADSDEIALTHHTSEGINIVCWGLGWQPGDELLTTTLEHEGGLLPAYAAARRFGVDVRVADLGLGEDPASVIDALERGLTSRTRLLLLSHVTWNTGAVLPLAEIVARAHARGVLVLVDGAQSVGAIPVDVRQSGADFYTVSGQKWLLGPEGMGALYVRRDRLSLLRQSFIGYLSLRDFEAWSLSGDYLPAPGARRFEVGTVFRPGLHAMEASLRFLDEDAGLGFVHARIQRLTAVARQRIAALPGATVYTPSAHAGLVAFTLAGTSPEAIARALSIEGYIVRTVPLGGRSVLRVSCGFYNTLAEIDRLCASLGALVPTSTSGT